MEKLVKKEAKFKGLEMSQHIHIVKRESVWLKENTKNVAKRLFNKISKPSQQNPRATVQDSG